MLSWILLRTARSHATSERPYCLYAQTCNTSAQMPHVCSKHIVVLHIHNIQLYRRCEQQLLHCIIMASKLLHNLTCHVKAYNALVSKSFSLIRAASSCTTVRATLAYAVSPQILVWTQLVKCRVHLRQFTEWSLSQHPWSSPIYALRVSGCPIFLPASIRAPSAPLSEVI